MFYFIFILLYRHLLSHFRLHTFMSKNIDRFSYHKLIGAYLLKNIIFYCFFYQSPSLSHINELKIVLMIENAKKFGGRLLSILISSLFFTIKPKIYFFMFSWSNSYSCYKNSNFKLISKFLLFYFVSISYNRNKSNFNVFRYFWSGVEPSNITCYSLLNLLLVFFGKKLSSCKKILVYFIAIKQNNTSPTV